MRSIIFTVAIAVLAIVTSRAQDSVSAASPESFLLELNIPKEWEIIRMKQGDDYTLSAQSPDKELYLFYCQFMNEKSNPRKYFQTYSGQFGLRNPIIKEVKQRINNKTLKFYYGWGDGEALTEKFKIFLLVTTVNKKNIIAYILYPLYSEPPTTALIERIMLYLK